MQASNEAGKIIPGGRGIVPPELGGDRGLEGGLAATSRTTKPMNSLDGNLAPQELSLNHSAQ